MTEEKVNEFALKNIRLVYKEAHSYMNVLSGGMEVGDLVQEGYFGLVKAVQRYNPSLGFKFSTYARYWIRHSISRALSNYGSAVRVPAYMIDLSYKCFKQKRLLSAQKCREVSCLEIAESLGVSEKAVSEATAIAAARNNYLPFSQEDVDSLSSGGLYADVESIVDAKMLMETIEATIDTLDSRTAIMVKMYFGVGSGLPPQTYEQIAGHFGVTRQAIHNQITKALGKIVSESRKPGTVAFEIRETAREYGYSA